jgi:small-conductance mechanosensitive channel
MLGALLGAGALIPAMIVLRQLIKRSLFPILNALVVFYFVDQLRAIATALPLLSRLLFVAELAGGIVCFALLLRSAKLTEASLKEGSHFRRLVRIWAGAGIALFVIAFVANAIGSVSLSNLLGNAFLNSAYLAVILYASIRIADGLLMLALRVRPLSLLGMVHQHRPLFRRRIQRLVRWLASSAWILFALEQLSLRKTVVEGIRALLTAKFGIGSLQISLGHVAAFVITVWLAFLFSRFLRFMLEEDVYPRVNLARGIPYAVSTTLHYVILLLGFFIAIAALGIDMTKFTILAGAFGVGLGFGMQTIVNNFVSGLILLFERPVKVGDVVQLGEHAGDLRRIGLRASVLRTWEGSEVIVPNGALISDEVVNWTLSDQQRRIEVNVGVAYGTDPELVIDLLTKVAELHDEILKDPAPQTLFKDFGDSALNFQLRAWTANFQRWMLIKSELTVGVNAALRDAGISIPFPQRDLHLQTIAPELSKSLSGRNGAVGAVDPNRR